MHALGKLDQALADFNAYFALGQTYAGAYYSRGRIHEEKGNTTAAIADYRAALKHGHKNDAYAKHVLPDAARRLKALESAVATAKPKDSPEQPTVSSGAQ